MNMLQKKKIVKIEFRIENQSFAQSAELLYD